ncbi:hypothetical protein DICPUDRAFT_147148 [Dictyostelium purpureum]|uniref:Phosphatidylinositol-specific phospholipase C X domain-containing protein n=1 Tax=Dictyostelium purpureum TaxID=5786 RepID=F0Z7S5_DICPU|nr:uncharacterized protein DICPUDRAFT_147148 [Dictyostelium purpureum]EGC39995.1 hypothetical protein DICPUDRAFT_147148 [Dictyostelium purpureum]|eukprot:XP_003283498.1 hypothetical protein DICPUDRAFT_147148 [Dictyostelium purpureum]
MTRLEILENNSKRKLSIIEKIHPDKLGCAPSTTFLTIHWDNQDGHHNNDDFLILSKGKPNSHSSFLRNQSFFTKHYEEKHGYAVTDHQFDENQDYHAGYCSKNKETKSYHLEESFSFKEYSQWMSIYWEQIKHKKVRDLVLPGSHDAATYGIHSSSERSPDYRSPWFAPNAVISKWSKTQSATIYKQLVFGVRYFDLRVAPTSSGELKVQHNMFSVPITEVLDDIAAFIKDKREIIILHWNHFNFLTDQQHKQLQSLIKTKLDGKMAPRELGVDVTVEQLEQTPIINIYDDRFSVVKENTIPDQIAEESCFWYHHSLRSAYDFDQYHSCKSVINFLEKELKEEHSTFWVLQCVLTADNRLSNFYQLAVDSVFDWTMMEMDSFLKLFEKIEKLNIKTNIIMTDFVTFYPLTRFCINQNLK